MSQISEFLRTRIDAKDFPSAAYLVAERGEIVLQDAIGSAVVEPERIDVQVDTIYDLASLTKVLITGLLCAKLIEVGEISLSDKISDYFTEFAAEDKREITIQNLLTHTSGFGAWKPFYLAENAPRTGQTRCSGESDPRVNRFILVEIGRTPLEHPINSKVVYSDFNFLVLGFLIEKIHSQALNEVAVSEIFSRLDLGRTFFGRRDWVRREIGASEFGNEYEKRTCLDFGYKISEYAWRDYQIWGEVHDGNCFFMNGVSGHAGLFSTAEETFKIARQFLKNETTLLKPETCKTFRTNFTPNLNEARSIAFQLAETSDSTASKALSKDSFGHLGFTGTSLWIEPDSQRIFILLTNRTHAHQIPFVNINSTRRKFHEMATAFLSL